MMKPFRTLLAAIALPIVLNSCDKQADAGGGPPTRIQPVEVMPIELMDLQETTGLVGSVAANESAELRPEYPGTVASIHFEEGHTVAQGEVLVRLDTRELEAQLAEAKASFYLAGSTLKRNRKLLESQAVSQLEVDAAVAEHARLKAVIDRLEVQLTKSAISAPFDGIAGARSISIGDYVTPQSIITTVDDLSRLKVDMQVPERYLPLLDPGSTFSLKAATSSGDDATTGEVYFVSPRIDVETRSTQVKGYIQNPPPSLKPGMFANITLVLRRVEKAMVVPETAVLSTPKGTVLIKPTEKDGTLVASFVPVKLGLRVPGWIQITPVGPPIQPGDKIVSSGVGGLILYPGIQLKLVDPVVTPGKPEMTDRKLND